MGIQLFTNWLPSQSVKTKGLIVVSTLNSLPPTLFSRFVSTARRHEVPGGREGGREAGREGREDWTACMATTSAILIN